MKNPVPPFLQTWDPARYSRAYLLSGIAENAVQAQVIEYLERRGVIVVPTDAGGKRVRAWLMARGARLPRGPLGDLPDGFPDLSGTLPSGRSVYIEVKRPGRYDLAGRMVSRPGALDPEQIKWLTKFHEKRALVGVAWSWQDVEALLKNEKAPA